MLVRMVIIYLTLSLSYLGIAKKYRCILVYHSKFTSEHLLFELLQIKLALRNYLLIVLDLYQKMYSSSKLRLNSQESFLLQLDRKTKCVTCLIR